MGAHKNDSTFSPSQERAKRARRKTFAPFSIGKQAALFVCLTILLLFVDLFLYMGITIYENNQAFGSGTPKGVTMKIGEDLVRNEDGDYELSTYAQNWMDEEQCWAILISNEGTVDWSRNAPESVIRPYTLADAATFARMGYLDDYPCFICKRDDGILVTGFPKDSYAMFPLNYWPQQTMLRTPFYIFFIFIVDAGIMFLAYFVSRRRVEKNIEPMVKSLDDLARGKPAHINATGSLSEVGESINAASAIMRRKDEARKRWVAGVSHDIRTPLAIAMGHAEGIAENQSLSDEVRASARIVVRQSARIRDLVSDLNIASKLEYDMQPLDAHPVAFARMVRSIAADCANDRLDERFSIEADISPAAEQVRVSLDERLITRAVRNLIDNSLRHNDGGCTITLGADVREGFALLRVADDGTGMAEESIARLNLEAQNIASSAFSEDRRDNGPVPPPHYEEYAAMGARAARTPIAPESEAGSAEMPPSLRPKELAGFNDHGLGLSLVARIVIAHGGRIDFSTSDPAGFETTMRFPLENS